MQPVIKKTKKAEITVEQMKQRFSDRKGSAPEIKIDLRKPQTNLGSPADMPSPYQEYDETPIGAQIAKKSASKEVDRNSNGSFLLPP